MANIVEPAMTSIRVKLLRPKIKVVLADNFIKYQSICCSESCLDSNFKYKSDLGGMFEQVILDAWGERNK